DARTSSSRWTSSCARAMRFAAGAPAGGTSTRSPLRSWQRPWSASSTGGAGRRASPPRARLSTPVTSSARSLAATWSSTDAVCVTAREAGRSASYDLEGERLDPGLTGPAHDLVAELHVRNVVIGRDVPGGCRVLQDLLQVDRRGLPFLWVQVGDVVPSRAVTGGIAEIGCAPELESRAVDGDVAHPLAERIEPGCCAPDHDVGGDILRVRRFAHGTAASEPERRREVVLAGCRGGGVVSQPQGGEIGDAHGQRRMRRGTAFPRLPAQHDLGKRNQRVAGRQAFPRPAVLGPVLRIANEDALPERMLARGLPVPDVVRDPPERRIDRVRVVATERALAPCRREEQQREGERQSSHAGEDYTLAPTNDTRTRRARGRVARSKSISREGLREFSRRRCSRCRSTPWSWCSSRDR